MHKRSARWEYIHDQKVMAEQELLASSCSLLTLCHFVGLSVSRDGAALALAALFVILFTYFRAREGEHLQSSSRGMALLRQHLLALFLLSQPTDRGIASDLRWSSSRD